MRAPDYHKTGQPPALLELHLAQFLPARGAHRPLVIAGLMVFYFFTHRFGGSLPGLPNRSPSLATVLLQYPGDLGMFQERKSRIASGSRIRRRSQLIRYSALHLLPFAEGPRRLLSQHLFHWQTAPAWRHRDLLVD